MQKCHPTMCLSDGMSYGGHFQLIGPDDNVLFEVASQQVFVAALAFFPQLASLVVGYNFGAFQIINLSTLTIECASPYEESMPPVLSFACQEPENDPRNFVYLWLCRSWTSEGGREKSKTGQGSHALCTMYAMNYDSKVWIEGHGLWYQGLASISPRFEFDILGGLGLRGQPVGPSRVFSALTVQLSSPPTASGSGGPSSVGALTASDEDSGSVLEQSLCLFGWVGGVKDKGFISLNHYLAVFDINQWYQAHMPSSLKLEESHLCPYMSFHLLDRVPGITADGTLSEVVMGAIPKPASWAQHISHTCNDSDWFPAALSYDALVLTSDSLVEYRCQSAQQAALALLTSCGPAAIVNPEEAHAVCVFAGLIPSDPHHHVSSSSTSPMMLEREALLNVALDQQLVSLLVKCVTEFSEGRFTNLGCSLPSLLDWAWGRVTEIKTSNDNLCLVLFDPDCGVVSSENIALLHQNLTNLITLATIITTIRDYAHSNLITLQGANELEGRVRVVRLMVLHLEAVLWFYHCGLLSPTSIEDPGDECCVPFPAELLSRIYRNRRTEIRNLSASLTGNEVLMIDGLLEEAAEVSGGSMGQAWEEEGGTNSSKSAGVYPPPSLHGLLNMFLLPYVPTTTKHRIVQYLFLDLASLLSDGYVRVVEELVKYPSSFSLSPSLIKLTQAFWLLDHKDFQEGLNVLLDPLVNPCDLTPWQHRRIMKAFLYQGEHGRALTYAKMRQPPKVDLDDIRLHLTLLLANKLVREAFHYQRAHRTTANTEDLLQHFFTGCEQQGRLESVIHLPLSSLEEAALVTYLRTSTSTSAHDYLLVYYLQRARFDDAALLQDSLRGGLGTARRRHSTRSALVHGYLTHLPDVASRLSSAVKRHAPEPIMYKKPPPLSAHIRQSSANIRSRASALEDQLGSPPICVEPYTPFRNAAQRRRAYEKGDLDDYDILVTPRRKESRDASHVVFPSMETSPTLLLEGETSGLYSLGPGRRSHLGESTHIGDGLIKVMESALRRSSMQSAATPRKSMTQNISADMLSLLQTPKIKRKRRPDTRPGPDDTLTDTPQSILKVRQMVQRPLSPATASDASVPVFPRLSARKAKISAAAAAAVVEESALNRSTDTSLTPKQLRFHLPKVQARAQLRPKGSSRLSADSDQLIEEEEEEVEEEEAGEEEEEMEEEAVEEEEEEMEQNTPKLEEEVKMDMQITVPRLESESQKPEKAMDMQGDVSPAEVSLEEEESSEVPSKETTLNDMFYSFVEEEEAADQDETEKANTEKDNSVEEEEEEMEELQGIEISREVGETDEDDLNTEADDDKISEEETQEEEKQEDSMPEDTSKAEKQDTELESVSGVSENGNIEKEDEDHQQQHTCEKTSQRHDKSAVSLSDTLDMAAEEVEEKPKMLPTSQESLGVEKDNEAPADFVALKEQEYGPEERGEGALREDEGFSEEIEPPHEEAQAPEEELEISNGGRSVILASESEGREVHGNQEDIEDKEEEEEKEKKQEEEEEEKKQEKKEEEKKVEQEEKKQEEKEEKKVEQEEKKQEEEEKEKKVEQEEKKQEEKEEEKKVEQEAKKPEEEEEEKVEQEEKKQEEKEEEKKVEQEAKKQEEEEEEKKMEQEEKKQEEEEEKKVEQEKKEEKKMEQEEKKQEEKEEEDNEEKERTDTDSVTHTTETPQQEKIFSIEECVPAREEKEDMDHYITTQEEEMIADAVSEGEEELCLNLESDDEVSPILSTTEVKSNEPNNRERKDEQVVIEEMEVDIVKPEMDEQDTATDQRPTEASIENERSQQSLPSGKENYSVDMKLSAQESPSAMDKDQEMAVEDIVESTLKENTRVHSLASEDVKDDATTPKLESEVKQSDQTFVVEESDVLSLKMEKNLSESKKELKRDETPTSYNQHKSQNDLEAAATDVGVPLGSQEQDTVDCVVPGDKDIPVPMEEDSEERMVSEADGASPPKRRKVEKDIQEEISHPIEEHETQMPTKEKEDEKAVEEKEGNILLTEMKLESSVALAESSREPPLSSPKEVMVVESLLSSSPAASPLSPPQEYKDPIISDTTQQHMESSLSTGMSPEHTNEAVHLSSQRKITRCSPARELITTPLRRSRRLSGASTSSAPSTPKRTSRSTTPAREEVEEVHDRRLSGASTSSPQSTPKRTTRSTTPAREEMGEVPIEMVTRSGRKLLQVPTPLTRSKGSPVLSLVTPSRRTRRTSGSQEEMKAVSQKLLLSPEVEAESEDTSSQQSQETLPAALPATPSRRITRKSHAETLETISEDKEVVSTKSEVKARTPTTPSKGATRRSRRLSASEGLETIEENALLTTKEDPQTPATPRRSSRRRSAGLQESVTTPQRKGRRTSTESLAEELPHSKYPHRTKRLSGDLSTVTPQKKTPRRRKEAQPDTPAKGAINEGHSSLLEKEVGSIASRTRRRSHSEDSTREGGESGRQGSVTSFVESLSASPTRSTPVTSVKDSESSEEDDRQTRRQRVKQQEGKEITTRRKSRRLTQASLIVDANIKSKRKSMKVYSLSDEASKFMDLMESGKKTHHASRSKRKMQPPSPSDSVILLRGSEEQEAEAEVEMESGSEEVNLETGLDVEDYSESSEGDDRPTRRKQLQAKDEDQESKQASKKRKSRRVVRASAVGSLHSDKNQRKSRSMKLYTLSDEAANFMDLMEESPHHVKRSRRKVKSGSPSSPVILLGNDDQEAEVEMESGSGKVNLKAGQDKEKNKEESNMLTTTTRALSSKRRPSSDTTTHLVLDSGEERQLVGEELSGTKPEEKKLLKGMGDEKVIQEILESKTEMESDVKDSLKETATTVPPQFKFAKPKAVSSKRENRALENLTNEAIKFLFSSPLAAGRTAKQTKGEEGSSSSESEAGTSHKRTSHSSK
ncbi:hypothetical protein O3P69_001874 [Scylla paramamosain]|uniref:ELYS-like domain-containing protein n=1 Tax=Scylla paramamosain TaxID=85552 RepID=A0AAW0V492_SCYPA